MQVLKSLEGQEVSITTLDREESEYFGELLEVGETGAIIKYDSHGRQFIDVLPWNVINVISHKVLDAK